MRLAERWSISVKALISSASQSINYEAYLFRNEHEANQNRNLAAGAKTPAVERKKKKKSMLYRAKIKIAGVLKMKHSRLFAANNVRVFQMPIKTNTLRSLSDIRSKICS